MSDILLITHNARYTHTALGLRCLLANLGALRERAEILEFTIAERPVDMLEAILARRPRIVGVGVYVWNFQVASELVNLLKRVRPGVKIVLGGPEVSHEPCEPGIMAAADHIIQGEAEHLFAQLSNKLLANAAPGPKVITAPLPDLGTLELPYGYYNEEDVAHRVLYVEASRGCPFGCEFCLSANDPRVRQFDLERLLAALDGLLRRGGRRFKFVDRTFNLDLERARRVLQFFAETRLPDLFLHFEMVPDRLAQPLLGVLACFPPGALQLEVGVQSLNPEVLQRIGRRQDMGKLEQNLRALRAHTQVHLHADLVAGLPGEDLDSFAAGFDRLLGLSPQEIQLGILKRLRGALITRHDAAWGMIYNPHPPYEILENASIDFHTMQRIKRFARYWDLIVNSGRFAATAPLIWSAGSPFWSFFRFSAWLHQQTGQTHAIALARLRRLLEQYLVAELGQAMTRVRDHLERDARTERASLLPPRQARHVRGEKKP